jgi:phage terminase large subunit
MARLRRSPRGLTLEGVAAAYLRQRAAATRGKPMVQYQRDPVAYALERMHIRLFPWQKEALQALADGIAGLDNPRLSVRSGQKSGKTTFVIVAALWMYECFENSTVYMCAAIISQTDNVMWKELGIRLRHAAAHGIEIDGKMGHSASSGMVSSDGSRSIKGLSGREIEALAGLSGRQLLIVDEASHLPEKKAQVLAGNMLGGGGALVFVSNPTRNSGPFYESFHGDKEYWRNFHVDGEKLAAWQAEQGFPPVPYTVNRKEVEEARERYGKDSPFWYLRVKGEWLRYETGRAVPMIVIEAAVARHSSLPDNGGPLRIGYDPAGPTEDGDEHAWAIVRGNKCLLLLRRRGLSEDAAIEETLALLRVHRGEDHEDPTILIDSEGMFGAAIYGRLRSISEERRTKDRANMFTVKGVKASSKFVHDKTKFQRVRSEIAWNLSQWIIEGGIPNDAKLQGELYEPTWHSLPGGELELTQKTELRDKLGRSPDSFDALALAVWHVVPWEPMAQESGPIVAPYERQGGSFRRGGDLDPYASNDWWKTGT